MSGIFDPPTQAQVSAALRARASARLAGLEDDTVFAYLAESVYLERKRFAAERKAGHAGDAEEQRQVDAIEQAARATHADRPTMERAVLELIDLYAHEIHNRFSNRTYNFATKLLPGALTRLLTATQPLDLVGGADFDPTSRIVVQGPVDRLRELGRTHTLVLAPTHVSNLDSPLIGYALYASRLPPVIYGAGLNLFSNPAMSFFMSRLGAYTVDRRKKHRIYKDVLKDYSIEMLGRRSHSLFFPGGTRSRSGRIESQIKKGLLGTAITAWQEGLEQGRTQPELLVVPCTLSFALVLEAETLIEDALAEEGQSRYIISDDEFSETRTVASFARRVLNLDASVYVRFGDPLDLMGNAVDEKGGSLDTRGQPIDRRGYVCDRAGQVERDPQRDQIYTRRLAESLTDAYHRDAIAMSTHVAAFAAFEMVARAHPRLDTFQLMFLAPHERTLDRSALATVIDATLTAIDRLRQAGRLHAALPGASGTTDRATAVLDEAIERFGRYHTRRALEQRQQRVTVDSKLALYYSNRLRGYGLEGEVGAAAATVSP